MLSLVVRCVKRLSSALTFPPSQSVHAAGSAPRRSPRWSVRSMRRSLDVALCAVMALLLPAAMRAQVSFTGAITTLTGGSSSPYEIAVSPSGNYLYVSNNIDKVSVINAATDTLVTNIAIGDSNDENTGIAINPAGTYVYTVSASTTTTEPGTMYVISTATNAVVATVSVGDAPDGVAVDPSGSTVYVAAADGTLSMINAATNTVTATVNACGANIATAVAVNPYAGHVYVTCYDTVAVVNMATNTVMDTISLPSNADAIAVAINPSGTTAYVADYALNEVSVIDTETDAVTTNVSVGSLPEDVALDPTGAHVYAANSGDGTVSVIDTATNSVTGTLQAAGYPTGDAVDANGNLYVADYTASTITKVATESVSFNTQAVGSTSAAQTLDFSIASGTTVGSIGVLTQGSTGMDFANAAGSTCTAKIYSSATDCTVNVSFAPTHPGLRMGAVVFYDGSGKPLTTVYVYGTGTGPQIAYSPGTQTTAVTGLTAPEGVAVDAAGNLYVAAPNNDAPAALYEYSPNGSGGWTKTATISTSLNNPASVAVDGAGNVFVCNYGGSVNEYSQSGGVWSKSATVTSTQDNYGLAVDGSGNAYVGNQSDGKVVEYSLANGTWSVTATVASGFASPAGIAVDSAKNIYVVDNGNGALDEIPYVNGAWQGKSTIATGFDYPFDVAVDAAGSVYVTTGDGVSQYSLVNGTWTRIAAIGSGVGLAEGVAVDASGNIYVTDWDAGHVVEVNRSTPPALSFATTEEDLTSSDSPQTVTVQNDGNENLTLTALSYPSDFPEAAGDPNACTGTITLGAGGECDLPIDFTPQRVGAPLSEDVTLTDNALNVAGAQQSIAVSGTSQVAVAVTADAISATAGSSFSGTVATFSSTDPTALVSEFTATINWGDGTAVSVGTISQPGGVGTQFLVAGSHTYAAPGTYTVTVIVTPSGATAASGTNTATVIAATTTTVASSASTTYSASAQSVPLTATVTSSSGAVNEGTVTFEVLQGSTQVGSAVSSSVVNGAAGVSFTLPAAASVGTYTIQASYSDTGGSFAASSDSTHSLTVVLAATSTSVTSSANPVLLQNQITLTATVASAAGTPSGTVTFLNGTTPLGTGTLTGGIATLITSSLPAGAQSITALYGGNADFSSSTSSVLTQVVQDFGFNISASSATALPGRTAVFTFTATPEDGATFPSAIALSLSGLPTGASGTFSPAGIAAGAGATTVTLTVHIPQTQASIEPGGHSGGLLPFSLALLLLPFAGRVRRAGHRLGRTLCVLLLLAAGIFAAAGVSGCGGTSGFFAQAQQSYPVTITGTSGALSHSATVTLTVE